MRAIPAALQAKLDSGVTTLAQAWKLMRRDGIVAGFTDHDRDLVIDGVTYRAGTGLAASEASSRFDLSVDGGEIAGDLRFADAVEAFVRDLEPGALVAPLCTAGFTDSHWLREAFGTVAYGFCPMRTMDPQLAARLVHSVDERISVEDLELAVRCFRHVAVEVTGAS